MSAYRMARIASAGYGGRVLQRHYDEIRIGDGSRGNPSRKVVDEVYYVIAKRLVGRRKAKIILRWLAFLIGISVSLGQVSIAFAEGDAKPMQRVIVELRTQSGWTMQSVFAAAEALPGLHVDRDYAPQPINPGEGIVLAPGEEVVLIRGTLDANVWDDLRSSPMVIGVWRDARVEPF